MQILIALAVLVVLSGPAALVLAIVASLKTRRLEEEIRELRRSPVAPVPSVDRAAATTVPSAANDERADTSVDARATPPPVPSSTVPPVARARQDLEARIGGEWLTWIGVLAIFFGTAFFLAVRLGTHPLAGVGQVWVGLGVSVAFLAVGTIVSRRSTLFLGPGLLGGGTALVFLAIFAAAVFHRILDTTMAYVLLTGASLLGAALALGQNSRTVAGLTLAGALVTPLLLEPNAPQALFFPYLVFVNAGVAFVRLRRNWPGLVLAAFLATAVLVLVWWDRFASPDTRTQALVGVGALFGLYFVLPFLVRATAPRWRLGSTALALANAGGGALFLWAWLDDLAFLRGVAVATLALFYVLAARIPVRAHARREAGRGRVPDEHGEGHEDREGRDGSGAVTGRTGHGGQVAGFDGLGAVHELAGLGLGALAIPMHFDLETVTLGWALLAILLVHLGAARTSLPHRLLGYGVLLGALGHHLLFDLASLDPGTFGTTETRGPQWAAGLASTAAILTVAGLLRRAARRSVPLESIERRAGTPLVLAAACFLLYLLSVQVWRELEDEGTRRAQLGLSFVWALYGGVLIALGFLARYRALRLAGVVLLLGLVLKLFTLDLSVLERGERIASFVGVGVLLLVVSLLYQRRRRKEAPEDGSGKGAS